MKMRHLETLVIVAISAAFVGGLACDREGDEGGEGGDALPAVQCDAAPVPRFEAMSQWGACTGCHSSHLAGAARSGAPVDFNYDSLEAAMFDPIETASVVIEGEMPPSGGLSAADRDLINTWAQCGTP